MSMGTGYDATRQEALEAVAAGELAQEAVLIEELGSRVQGQVTELPGSMASSVSSVCCCR